MSETKELLKKVGKNHHFFCVACGTVHVIDESFGFNNDYTSPTITPSFLYTHDYGEGSFRSYRRCHVRIADGKLTYMADCTHAYRGQTVPMRLF